MATAKSLKKWKGQFNMIKIRQIDNIELSEIQIIPIKPTNGLVGFASFVVNDALFIGSIGIFTKPQGGYRLTYPTKKTSSQTIFIINPINRDVGQLIEKEIISRFEEVTNNYVRHNSINPQ
ncbi:MAG: septation protein SpoVG family protein [Patescibacteria group bacterium]